MDDDRGSGTVAYGEDQAERVRRLLSGRSDVVEKRIVGGGLGFMINGHLCCGLSDRGLTVRVGPEAKREVVAMPHVGPLVLGESETAALVIVEADGFRDDLALSTSVERVLRFVETLS